MERLLVLPAYPGPMISQFRLPARTPFKPHSRPYGSSSILLSRLQRMRHCRMQPWPRQGRLPAGLTLSSAGILSGTPIGLGTVSFTIQVTDSFATQQQAVRTFSLTVASILAISTVSVPNALQNSAYSQQLQNVGGA